MWDAGGSALDEGCRMWGAGCRMDDIGHRMQNAGCRCGMLEVGCRI